MRFDLTDLRLFLHVHEAGTITGGAQRSCMTLASASERIRGMETRLGAPLLLRDSRGVSLTPAGRTLLHHARLMALQMDRLQGDLADYGKGFKGHVRLLCNTSALSEHLPQALSRFLSEHPGMSIDLEERSSAEIVDALRNGVCDIGMASDSADMQGLDSHSFCSDPLVLVVSKASALGQRRVISLSELVDCAFVGLVEGSALQDYIAQHARLLGKRLSYRIRLRSFESVCRLVGQGIGVGIVPRAVAMRCARSAKLQRVALSDAWADRQLVLCVRQNDPLPAHVQQLMRHLLASRPA